MAHPPDITGPVAARDVAPEKVTWLWRERIPKGMICVVAGKPDQGKGLFNAHVAAAVSKRGEKVLYSAVEDDHGRMTRPRLEAAGANLDNVFLWRFALPEQMDELRAHVIDNQIALVCMDPFSAHLRGVSKYSDSIRKVLTPLGELAEQTGCSILVTEHANKRVSANAHPLAAIGGSSSGLVAAARMAYVFGTDPQDRDRRILCNVKANLRDVPKAIAFETDSEDYPIVGEVPSLVIEKETEFDAKRLLGAEAGDGRRGPRPDKRAAAAEWLTKYLHAAGKPVKSSDILEDARQYGLTVKTTRNAAVDMAIVKNPALGGRNCTWDLPADVKRALKAGGTND